MTIVTRAMTRFITLVALLSSSIGCSRSSSSWSTRIAGGFEVEPHSLPFQVLLVDSDLEPVCGGALISNRSVLTAAHCCAKEVHQVMAGAHNISHQDGHEQHRFVSGVRIHEEFDDFTLINDICIVITDQPFLLNEFVSLLSLPDSDFVVEWGSAARVSGWGWESSESGQISAVLRAAFVPVVNDDVCVELYAQGDVHVNPDTMMCAGSQGVDACIDDDGGPLICLDESEQEVHCGIVSFGRGCGDLGFPGVYTETHAFLQWIQDNSG